MARGLWNGLALSERAESWRRLGAVSSSESPAYARGARTEGDLVLR